MIGTPAKAPKCPGVVLRRLCDKNVGHQSSIKQAGVAAALGDDPLIVRPFLRYDNCLHLALNPGGGTPVTPPGAEMGGVADWTAARPKQPNGEMGSSEHGGKTDGHTLIEVKVEKYEEIIDQESPHYLEEKPLNCFDQQVFKRLSSHDGLDGVHSEQNQTIVRKRIKVDDNFQDSSVDFPPSQSLTSSPQDTTVSSYRKPLYGISHRITEKKAASIAGPQEPEVRDNNNGLHFPEQGNRLDLASAVETSKSPLPSDSQLHPLFEKMFFILNTLNTSMTQLHSKVDLLSLEVTRIKKQIKPSEMTIDFKPPPEYLLTRKELVQLTEQTQTAGELGCRLLVQLFPDLFTAKECAHGCQTCSISCKPSLDSLHLQLIRNYVESCYPLIKNENLWQNDCLLHVTDFFNQFWAQKDMLSGSVCEEQYELDMDQNLECRFINEDGREQGHSLDSEENDTNEGQFVKSGLVFDPQETGENLTPDDVTSLDEFVVFLLNRIFPEVFEEGRLPKGHSNGGHLIINSDRLGIIRKYMETNFPEVPEDTWLQLCIQRMDEFCENTNDGDQVTNQDEIYSHVSFPDDDAIATISDYCNYEKSKRSCKRSWPTLVDFGKMENPFPDFEVPQEYVLSKEQLKSIYDSCVSIGNFATRLLVLMFPELFTQENVRKQYNCSGSLGKKQLDPVRINLIRHYVQLLYPRARSDRVWSSEFVVKLDERCRRRDTEQRRLCQQGWKSSASDQEADLRDHSQISFDRPKEELEPPSSSLPPERSSKDFCKVPVEEIKVSMPDFPVPSSYLLSDSEIQEIVQQSLSVGNFASRLLVRLFPELFTHENLRLQFNHSGACNKKQLDPVRLRLIRHYVEAVYPVDKVEEVWHYECVPSIDERCRRPNRKKCDILKKTKRSNSSVSWP